MLHMKQNDAASQRQRDDEIDSMIDADITAQKDIDTVRNDCVWFRTHDSNKVAKSEIQTIKEHLKTLNMSLITITVKLKWYLPSTLAPPNRQPVAFVARMVEPCDNFQQPRAQTPETPTNGGAAARH